MKFQERIEEAESELLQLTGIPLAYITRKYVTFDHAENGQEQIKIRTFIIDDSCDTIGGKQKPTLVIVHGFAAAFVMFYPILKPLMEHYRIVGIDQLGHGASSRVTLTEEFTRDQEKIEEYQVGWLEKWVAEMTDAGDLPEKFLLKGHSYGGYLCSLYASRNQERVQALFLNSPIGHECIPDNYDELGIRIDSSQKQPATGYMLNFWKS